MRQRWSSKLRLRDFRQNPLKEPADVSAGANGQDSNAPRISRRKYLRDYLRWLYPFRRTIALVLGLSILVAGLDMVWPILIKSVVDTLSGSAERDSKLRQLNVLGLAILGVLLVKQAIDTYRGYISNALNARVIFRLRGRLFEKVLSLPLGRLGQMKSGGIVARLSGDVDSVSGLVNQAILSPGVAIVRIVIGVAVLLWLSWQLALAAAVLLPPMAIVSFVWLHKVRPIYRSIREDRTTIDARVTETFGGIRVVRAFRREPHEKHDYAVGHHTVIRKGLFAEAMELALGTVWGLLIPGTSLLIVWFGGWLTLHGNSKVTVGDIFAFQIYAVLLIQPVWQIISSVSTTQRSLAAMERIFSVLAEQDDKPDAPDALDAPQTVRQFSFENVSFEYRTGVLVIQDFTLNVTGGQTVALVGPSGAGKTTITDLVARFHDPTRGVIRVNGIDLRQLKLRSYRSLLAVVQQEVFLFDGTVRENISYGRRGVTQAEIEQAARRANAHEFIAQLPEGYDTVVGERGFKLSGGQRQRLSIARAILADPQILILDEATSNLDTESEQLIQASMTELLRGRTTFVIAHRLSTVTHADLIVVIDKGRLVESGTHETLLSRGGLYAEMVERQSRSLEGMRVL